VILPLEVTELRLNLEEQKAFCLIATVKLSLSKFAEISSPHFAALVLYALADILLSQAPCTPVLKSKADNPGPGEDELLQPLKFVNMTDTRAIEPKVLVIIDY
jgi:hypothetical protein